MSDLFGARRALIGGLKSVFLDLYFNISTGEFMEKDAAEKWASGGKKGSRRVYVSNKENPQLGLKYVFSTEKTKNAVKIIKLVITTLMKDPAEFLAAQLMVCKDFDTQGSPDRQLAADHLADLGIEFDPQTFNIVCRLPAAFVPDKPTAIKFITNTEAQKFDQTEELRTQLAEHRKAGGKKTPAELATELELWSYLDRKTPRSADLKPGESTPGALYLVTKVISWFNEISPNVKQIVDEFLLQADIAAGRIDETTESASASSSDSSKRSGQKSGGARSVMGSGKKVQPPKAKKSSSAAGMGEPNIASDPRQEEEEMQEKEFLATSVKNIVEHMMTKYKKKGDAMIEHMKVASGLKEPTGKGRKDVFTLDTNVLRIGNDQKVTTFVMGVIDSSRLFKKGPTMKVGINIQKKMTDGQYLVAWYPTVKSANRTASDKKLINFVREKVLQAAFDEFISEAKLGDASFMEEGEESEEATEEQNLPSEILEERINKLPKPAGEGKENIDTEAFKRMRPKGGNRGFSPDLIRSLPKIKIDATNPIQGVLPIVLPDKEFVSEKIFESDDVEQVGINLKEAFDRIRKFDPTLDTTMSKVIQEEQIDTSDVILTKSTFKIREIRTNLKEKAGVDVRTPSSSTTKK